MRRIIRSDDFASSMGRDGIISIRGILLDVTWFVNRAIGRVCVLLLRSCQRVTACNQGNVDRCNGRYQSLKDNRSLDPLMTRTDANVSFNYER